MRFFLKLHHRKKKWLILDDQKEIFIEIIGPKRLAERIYQCVLTDDDEASYTTAPPMKVLTTKCFTRKA